MNSAEMNSVFSKSDNVAFTCFIYLFKEVYLRIANTNNKGKIR